MGIMQCSFNLVTAVAIAQHWEKMSVLIFSPTNCKILAVIRFLHTQKQSPAEIHRQLCHMYVSNIMSNSTFISVAARGFKLGKALGLSEKLI